MGAKYNKKYKIFVSELQQPGGWSAGRASLVPLYSGQVGVVVGVAVVVVVVVVVVVDERVE